MSFQLLGNVGELITRHHFQESLLQLCFNLKRQLQIMKDQRLNGALTNAATASAAPTIGPAVSGNNGWVVVPRQDPSRLSWDTTMQHIRGSRREMYLCHVVYDRGDLIRRCATQCGIKFRFCTNQKSTSRYRLLPIEWRVWLYVNIKSRLPRDRFF